MQGVSLITDASGQPTILTIDLRTVPADVSLLLEGLLARVQQDVEGEEWLNLNEPGEKPARKGGSMAGEVWMADDFNAPLNDQIAPTISQLH